MKKLLALAVIAGGVLFVVKRNKAAKAEADLWREATAPEGSFGSASSNGSAPAKAADASRNN
ncbi:MULTISPECIES: DLW-39 family protein [Amycolatopsis]|uniref:DLW-39 family protein n=1 Tax=Amycolatopsis samaneae TaxID=664691 RepID=A0ABW5GJY7_9PSEU